MISKQCPICGKIFNTAKSKTVFCSISCVNKSRTKKKKVQCKNCGKEFLPSRIGGIYCSRKCSAEAHKKYKICQICGTKFCNRGNGKYCCIECYIKSRVKKDIECPVCGKKFHPEWKQKYCSNKCWGIAQRTHKTKICPVCGNNFKESFIGQTHCSNKCYHSTIGIKERECPICGKIFKPYINSILTCSKECHSEYMKNKWSDLPDNEKKERLNKLRDGDEKIVSKPNKSLANLLIKEGYNVDFEYWLGGYYYDLKVGDTLIEINPRAHHNSTWAPPKNKNSKPKDKYYHKNKVICAVENGYNIIMKRDWIKNKDILRILAGEMLEGINDYYISSEYDINMIGEPRLHWFNYKGKQHKLDQGYDKVDMISEGYVEIYDAGEI